MGFEIICDNETRKSYRKIQKKSNKIRDRAKSKKAKPSWYSHAHFRNILKDLYKIDSMSIDHIIPLNHTKVCGLHVQDNWQIMSIKENRKKDNKFLVQQVEELMMFQLHREGMTDKIPKDYLHRSIK